MTYLDYLKDLKIFVEQLFLISSYSYNEVIPTTDMHLAC